jgi:hypothetical protein
VFKVVKSGYLSWQESITRKQHDLHDENKLNQPAGVFTELSMERSQQSWVKMYTEDITDSSGRALFYLPLSCFLSVNKKPNYD